MFKLHANLYAHPVLVMLVTTRCRGIKRPPEDISRDPGLLATLAVYRATDGIRAQACLEDSPAAAPHALHQVRLVKIDHRGFLILGGEPDGKIWEQTFLPQGWWCKFPNPDETAVAGGQMNGGRS